MPTELLDNRINQIAKKTGCSLSKKQGKFNLTFDIRNLNFSKYRLERENTYFELVVTCELLEGTSDKPSYFSGNTATQNRYSIFCKYKSQNSIPSFSIYESGFIGKVFGKKTIDIKCRDNNFRNYIDGLSEISLLKEKINKSAEISPAFNHRKTKEQSELTMLYQSFTIELELLEALIHFAIKINTEYNKV